MQIDNTECQYGIVAVILHWAMAVLIIALIVLGLYMTNLPNVGFNTKKIFLILLHKELGMLALGLILLRSAWRLINVIPKLVESIALWQKFAARFVHGILYVLMFALPISGWLMASSAGLATSFLGLFELPKLVPVNAFKVQVYLEIHKWLSYGLIFVLCLHIGAALDHHFIRKDDTLKRMLL